MEKDKLIIVFYIDIRTIDPADIPIFMHNVADKTRLKAETEDTIYLPIYGESRVECINPVYITDGELIKKHERLMSELHEHLKNQLDDKKDD